MTVEEELVNARQVVNRLGAQLLEAQRQRATADSENKLLRLTRNDLDRLMKRCEPIKVWLAAGVPIPRIRDAALADLAKVMSEIKDSSPRDQIQSPATQRSKVSENAG